MGEAVSPESRAQRPQADAGSSTSLLGRSWSHREDAVAHKGRCLRQTGRVRGALASLFHQDIVSTSPSCRKNQAGSQLTRELEKRSQQGTASTRIQSRKEVNLDLKTEKPGLALRPWVYPHCCQSEGRS